MISKAEQENSDYPVQRPINLFFVQRERIQLCLSSVTFCACITHITLSQIFIDNCNCFDNTGGVVTRNMTGSIISSVIPVDNGLHL